MNEMYIYSIRYNDHVSGHPKEYIKGQNDVLKISPPSFHFIGEVSKPCYDISFANGDVLRLYDFTYVLIKQKNYIYNSESTEERIEYDN